MPFEWQYCILFTLICFSLLQEEFEKLEKELKVDPIEAADDETSETFYGSFIARPKVKENSHVVFNLSTKTTSETLYKHFLTFGAITCIEILTIESTKQRVACIYIQNSIATMSSSLIDSNLVHIISQKSRLSTPSRSVMLKTYMPTLGMKFSAKTIDEYFSQYGKIVGFSPAKVISRDDGYQHAFLKFCDYQSSYAAITESPHIVGELLVVVLNAKDL